MTTKMPGSGLPFKLVDEPSFLKAECPPCGWETEGRDQAVHDAAEGHARRYGHGVSVYTSRLVGRY